NLYDDSDARVEEGNREKSDLCSFRVELECSHAHFCLPSDQNLWESIPSSLGLYAPLLVAHLIQRVVKSHVISQLVEKVNAVSGTAFRD
ncbi:hypothetical protein PENTCL1PPCAC_2774, partial [Pristionchus entomophagus]